LDENNSKLKIIDFGLSTFYSKNELLSSPVGSILYAPPEMHLSEKYSGELADIWNAGLVLYFMVCGYLPFSEEDE
jgi:non-specific serine/threonine protein kinase